MASDLVTVARPPLLSAALAAGGCEGATSAMPCDPGVNGDLLLVLAHRLSFR